MTDSIVTGFRETGFAVAPGVVARAVLDELRVEADRLVRRFTDGGYRSDDYWFFEAPGTGQPVLYRIHNLEKQGSSLITGLFVGGTFHHLAATILGTPARPTVAAMIVKTPGLAAAVPWHRDRTSVPPHVVCNLSLFLDDSNADNGCLEMVPRSNLLADDADVTETHQRGPVQLVTARAGDVVVHDVRTVHGSRPNTTGTYRRSIIIEFASVDVDLPREDG
jgi:phytanoyl-CoA hydroxylase